MYHVLTLSLQLIWTTRLASGGFSEAHVDTNTPRDASMLEALVRLLEDPTAFPEGGFIGFSLSHKYPLDVDMDGSRIIEVSGIK